MPDTEGGMLEKPEFGIMPVKRFGNFRPPKPFEYEELLEMVRERPGEAAKIAVFKMSREGKIGRKQTLSQVNSARVKVWNWLLKNKPLEAWRISTFLIEGTWGDRELWVTYLGQMTEEEALKVTELRVTAYSLRSPHSTEEKSRARDMLKAWETRRRQGLVE